MIFNYEFTRRMYPTVRVPELEAQYYRSRVVTLLFSPLLN